MVKLRMSLPVILFPVKNKSRGCVNLRKRMFTVFKLDYGLPLAIVQMNFRDAFAERTDFGSGKDRTEFRLMTESETAVASGFAVVSVLLALLGSGSEWMEPLFQG